MTHKRMNGHVSMNPAAVEFHLILFEQCTDAKVRELATLKN